MWESGDQSSSTRHVLIESTMLSVRGRRCAIQFYYLFVWNHAMKICGYVILKRNRHDDCARFVNRIHVIYSATPSVFVLMFFQLSVFCLHRWTHRGTIDRILISVSCIPLVSAHVHENFFHCTRRTCYGTWLQLSFCWHFFCSRS